MCRVGVVLVTLELFLTACVGSGERDLTPVVGESIPVGDHPSAIAYNDGASWVANGWDKTVSRIDTRQVVATIPVVAGADTLTAGEGGVWVLSSVGGGMRTSTDQSGTTSWSLGAVSRFDPKTSRETARISPR